MPWQLHIPDLTGGRRGFQLVEVATAPGHSLLLARLKKRQTKRRRFEEEPMLFAWGFSAQGRLGLVPDAEKLVEDQLEMGTLSTPLVGPRDARTYPPIRVDSPWRPTEVLPTVLME